MLFEVVADSLDSCIAAQNGGADRVELCANLLEGGTTPSFGFVTQALKTIALPVHVLIRPRAGDFLYKGQEVETMASDIETLQSIGIHGIVIGALDQTGNIDLGIMRELMQAGTGLQFTFHRAFDVCASPYENFEKIKALGFHRLLTSGQKNAAPEGAKLIGDLVSREEDQITVMAGGGIRMDNIVDLVKETKVKECHFSFRKTISSEMMFKNSEVNMGQKGTEEYSRKIADENLIKEAVLTFQKHGI